MSHLCIIFYCETLLRSYPGVSTEVGRLKPEDCWEKLLSPHQSESILILVQLQHSDFNLNSCVVTVFHRFRPEEAKCLTSVSRLARLARPVNGIPWS